MKTVRPNNLPKAWSVLLPALVAAVAVLLLLIPVRATFTARSVSTSQRPPARYPYGSAAFAELVEDSYSVASEGSPAHFHKWLKDAYRSARVPIPGTPGKDFERDMAAKGREMAGLPTAAARAAAERRLAEWAHRFVKKAIPRFSLDRGYEFHNVVTRAERQCLLQSVLIAGMLQAMGCDAGVAMVYRNERGDVSNNGHVTVLLKLADGAALLVDASEPVPFARHTGLLVSAAGSYRYVAPAYAPRSATIERFLATSGGSPLVAAKVNGLDTAFVRSQFWYYRGERAPGGVISEKRTARGLAASRQYLEKSVQACPGNSLAVYMLGRTRLYEGDRPGARKLLARAERLYAQYGWVPGGLSDASVEASK